MLLSDFGAEVVKIEHPKYGDALRDSSDFGSSVFNYVNRNKKSVTLNLKDDEARDIFYRLIEGADVVVENFAPGTPERLGVDYESLREVNPALVYCSIKGFNSGPYENRPALDPVAEALSGLMSTTGYPDHPPARAGTNVADKTASFYGAMGVMGALFQRKVTGDGQKINAPIFEGTVTLMGGTILYSQVYDEVKEPLGGGGQSQWAPYDVFQTRDDKWVFVGVTSDSHWSAFSDVLGIDEDGKFDTNEQRMENADAVGAVVSERLQEFGRAELLELFKDVNVPIAPVNNTKEVSEDRHLRETGMLSPINTAEGETGVGDVPGNPLLASGHERVEPTDPPRLGEHTDEILSQLQFSEDEIATLRSDDVV